MADKVSFRKLTAAEIECRVSTVSEKGCSLLLYKDARVDQNLLDETFGIFGWQRKHEVIDGQLFCTVSVKDPSSGEWVSKQDVGVESYTEKEKGRASDSFKRACFNLGIGRELYTAPFIWVSDCELKEKNGKYTTYDRFKVKEIDYDKSGNISRLVIANAKSDKVVYETGKVIKPEKPKGEQIPTKDEMKNVGSKKIDEKKQNILMKQCEDSGINPVIVCDKLGVANFAGITEKQFLWLKNNWTKEIVSASKG